MSLLPSKLRLETVQKSVNTISRARLLALIDAGSAYPVTLLVAPAGCGKTTLLSHYVQNKSNIGSISLDESDNDSEVFKQYLLASVNNNFVPTAIPTGENLLTVITELLVHLASQPQKFTLILDDYQSITNSEIHKAIKFLIKNQGDNLRLIISSRTAPPLSLTNMRVKNNLFEITSNDLSFTLSEIVYYFKQTLGLHLSKNDLLPILEQTEGWAMALSLIRFSLTKNDADHLSEPQSWLTNLDGAHLADYLREEVFATLPLTLKRMMQRLSLLHSFNEDLAIAITNDLSAIKKLNELASYGLFMSKTLDKGKLWYKFHPLMRDYLQQSLKRDLLFEVDHINVQAALGWQKLGFDFEALDHAQKLSNNALLIHLLNESGWRLFHQGYLNFLDNLLERLGHEVAKNPQLLLLKAWIAQSSHRFFEVRDILSKIDPHIATDTTYHAQTLALLAQVELNAGNHHRGYELAQKSLENLPLTFTYAQIVANCVLAESLHCQGNLPDALKQMTALTQMAQKHQCYHYVIYSQLQRAEILMAQGAVQSAFDLLQNMSPIAEHYTTIPIVEFYFRLKAKIQLEWLHLDQAKSFAKMGLCVLTNEEDRGYSNIMLARIAFMNGEYHKAKQLYHLSLAHLNPKSHLDLQSQIDALSLMFYEKEGDREAISLFLEQMGEIGTPTNHFTQRAYRNWAKAVMLLEDFTKAQSILHHLIAVCKEKGLICDLQKALILQSLCYVKTNHLAKAKRDLTKALELCLRSNIITPFIQQGNSLISLIREIIKESHDELLCEKAQLILRAILTYHKTQNAHFDDHFIKQLLAHDKVPEILKISPLTTREWQVLGLLYRGMSNEEIGKFLHVAMPTTKTHIRNIYQKLGISSRKQAQQYTQRLINLMQ